MTAELHPDLLEKRIWRFATGKHKHKLRWYGALFNGFALLALDPQLGPPVFKRSDLGVKHNLNPAIALRRFQMVAISLFDAEKCMATVRERHAVTGLGGQCQRRFDRAVAAADHQQVLVGMVRRVNELI